MKEGVLPPIREVLLPRHIDNSVYLFLKFEESEANQRQIRGIQ